MKDEKNELFKTIRLVLIVALIAGVGYVLFLADTDILAGLFPAGTGLLAFIAGRMGKDTGRLDSRDTSERLDSMDERLTTIESATQGLYDELTNYEERVRERYSDSQSVAGGLVESVQSGRYTVNPPVDSNGDSDNDDDITAIELGWDE